MNWGGSTPNPPAIPTLFRVDPLLWMCRIIVNTPCLPNGANPQFCYPRDAMLVWVLAGVCLSVCIVLHTAIVSKRLHESSWVFHTQTSITLCCRPVF